ncbi:acyl-CoA dehydrogenase family protein [Actibacterium sp. XHP0104]|uniref:acyl-CoA dehydrogenase family protein n=1 Tax=Actibacterium sp. XHP0104 TaxID=2984335 RepID=UPI0021E79C62|nr:acyl-CoA dehydrogenase family protein [Actibacterium sp. XHP0104]MCV2881465.1 acyl-CoA dehydrogenase family protein [Actibacterium sp. XHP0104]
MIPFAAQVEDILFSLEHVAGVSRLPDWDADLAREIIQHFAAFAEAEIAPLDEPGDAQGCRLEHGRVRMPDGFGAAYRAYAEQGWPGLGAPADIGGQGMPAPVQGAVSEIFTGACHALQMVVGLVPGAIRTLLAHGTPDQQARYLGPLIDGSCLATMALTEPGAGSDLSGIRTRGTRADDGWRLSGEKIFISGGDQDMSERILHLVLARTDTAPGKGTRGLSLFLCPSHLPDGSRNSARAARIEEKMGLHASPTCQMVFDTAHAELIGAEGEGLKAMFTMMNHARMDVALQGVAHAARAAQIARAYAAERVQGRDAGGQPVTLDRHPDVARMLREQQALAIGGRAMCHLALVALEGVEAPGLIDFLTPICKVFCTEAGIRSADLGIQVLGGYGYCREYRVEQTLRDARICAIYEGANGIHALTLATRLLQQRGGACADAFEALIEAEAPAAAHLAEALALWRRTRARLVSDDHPAEAAHEFMRLAGLMLYQAMWLRIETASAHAPDPDHLRDLAAHVRRGAAADLRAIAVMLEG